MIKYTESKEKSAEILRNAISLMVKHDAPFNPRTFAVWYEYVAGINPKLSKVIKQIIDSQQRLGDDDIQQFFREHIAPPNHQEMSRITEQFTETMSDVAGSATHTENDAEKFDQQPSVLVQALESNDPESLSPHTAQTLQDTSNMRRSAQDLDKRVANSRAEIKTLEEELCRVRDEDLFCPLTHALNRKGFDRVLATVVNRAAETGEVGCLVMLDIDHFKKVNDIHGHAMGDRVLGMLGGILRACISEEKGFILARYGGEEFAVLLPGAPIQIAEAVAENIRQRVKALKMRNRKTKEVVLTVTVSLGVATMKLNDQPDTLIARADAALYQSKQNGRDRVTLASSA